ncbi:MAG: hypothetical protein LV480_04115 [Methylacidiphilales bacterium]|nr:hypothetical protein [Candidatus Methylacidiphilales bacterium]
MRPGPPHDSPLEENDPVWRLLGESPRPEPDPWFTQRALTRCREVRQAAEAGALSSSFSGMWRWALGGGLGVCLAVLLMVPRSPFSPPAPAANQQNVQEAFAIMASVGSSDSDSDSDSSSSSSWQDSASL